MCPHETALASILGEGIAGLLVRLKRFWEDEFQWEKRDLKAYAYIWVDGIYFNEGLMIKGAA